jgi:DNA polymerase-3 subunit epsilon
MKVDKTIVVFDLETTGPWVERDKIIEIALIKITPDGTRETYHSKVNPGVPIPEAVVKLTGITNEEVEKAPPFRDIARDVLNFIQDADIGGFNVERFDLPLLAREFNEIGLAFTWDKRKVFDAQKVYHLNEKRDLTAAYQFYCGQDLGNNAHSALADTEATVAILEAQVKKYGGGSEAVEVLGEYDYQYTEDFYDKDRRFRWWNGELYMMFGKYAKRNSLKEVAKMDRAYLEWIKSANFSQEVKDLVANALEGKFPSFKKDG